ncbi:MAG TPA: hypothetical protein VNS58_25840 [Puia sp.]|nr:hypothetical protein [Puia sp.]
MLLKEEIDAKDFREIRMENEKKIQTLEASLIEISKTTSKIGPFLDKVLSVLSRLDQLYHDGDMK